MMENKSLRGILLVPVVILLVPLIAMQFTAEVAWSVSDFVFAWALMMGVGLTYQRATRRTVAVAYRAAVGLALATTFLLIWINLAVGLIGSEDNPANRLYLGVLVVGAAGACLARFEPRRMVRVLLATAFIQLAVPLIAVMIWKPPFTSDLAKEFILNACFAVLFVGSAWLFRRAAGEAIGSMKETVT